MDTIKIFAERLKELRQERGIGQIALAKEIGVGKSIVSVWKTEKSEPTLNSLVKLARFFDVSLDYLCGIKDC